MRAFVNQHSFVLGALVLLGIAWAVTWRVKRKAIRLGVVGVLAVAFVVTFLWLRTGGGDVRSPADVDRALAGGRPVLLEFYSDY